MATIVAAIAETAVDIVSDLVFTTAGFVRALSYPLFRAKI